MNSTKTSQVFYTILLSQFCGTSLWFAGNAILPQLQSKFNWPVESLGYLISSVQLGFIVGTLASAWSGISDRISPSKVFFASCLLGASGNLICLLNLSSFNFVLTSRFLTGFFLAGIYPVGMKIAADWREHGLGFWLGALVGALVIGTGFPHALNLFPDFVEAKTLTAIVSLLAAIGGVLVLVLVKDGPFRKIATRFSFSSVRQIFRHQAFRSAAFGYFGHMWELYAFWAFVPWALSAFKQLHGASFSTPLWSFIIIATGFLGCLAGGQLSGKHGSKKVATIALACSGLCCLISPLLFNSSTGVFHAFMIFWGAAVIADSPQFSALIAQAAPPEVRGSAITISTCMGFAITIFSIQLLNFMQHQLTPQYLFLLLVPGPLFGLIALYSKRRA